MQTNNLNRYQNKERRVNLKSKRKRNLIKKAIELSTMLDMKVLIVLKDLDTLKLSIYNSGDQSQGHFDLERVQRELRLYQENGHVAKTFDDSHYEVLKATSNYRNHKVQDKKLSETKEEQTTSVNFTDGQNCSANFQSVQPNQYDDRISSQIQQAQDLCNEVLADSAFYVENRQLEISNKCDSLKNLNPSQSFITPDQGIENMQEANFGQTHRNQEEEDQSHFANFDCQSSYINDELEQQANGSKPSFYKKSMQFLLEYL